MQLNPTVKRAGSAGVVFAGLAVTAAAIPVGTPEANARRWAAGLDADGRLSYLDVDTLAGLPGHYRRALSRSFNSPSGQVNFWSRLLTAYRATHEVSAVQDRVLKEVEETLTESLWDGSIEAETVMERITALHAKVSAGLGADAALWIFQAGGAAVGNRSLPVAEQARELWRVYRPGAVTDAARSLAPALLATSCNCLDDGDCYYESHCDEDVACEPYSPPPWNPYSGCGFLNVTDCHHRCSYSEPPL